jgi:hypothetical protein
MVSNIQTQIDHPSPVIRKNSAKKRTNSPRVNVKFRKSKGRVIILSSSSSSESSMNDSASTNKDVSMTSAEQKDDSYYLAKFNCKPCAIKLSKLSSSELQPKKNDKKQIKVESSIGSTSSKKKKITSKSFLRR